MSPDDYLIARFTGERADDIAARAFRGRLGQVLAFTARLFQQGVERGCALLVGLTNAVEPAADNVREGSVEP